MTIHKSSYFLSGRSLQPWISFFSVFVVCLHIMATYVFSFEDASDLPRYYRYTTLMLLACGFWGMLRSISSLRLRLNPALLCYVAWLGWCFISLYIHDVHADTLRNFDSLVKVTLVAFSYYFIVKTYKQFLVVLGGYGFAVLLFALYNYGDLQAMGSSLGYERFAGSAENPNTLAIMGVISFWSLIALFLVNKRKMTRLLCIGMGALVYFMVLYTGSRKGLIGLPMLIGLVYYFVIRKMKLRKLEQIGVHIAFCALLLVVIAGIFQTEYIDRIKNLTAIYSESSSSRRYDMGLAGWKMFKDYPVVGVGYDQFKVHAREYGAPSWSYAHSTLVEMFADLGFIGGVLYFGFYYLIYGRTAATLNDPVFSEEDEFRMIWLGLIKSLLIVLLFINLTAVVHADKVIVPILFLLLAGFRDNRAGPVNIALNNHVGVRQWRRN